MNNQYEFYPNMDLDIDKLKEIIYRRLDERLPDPKMASHHRYVSDEPYLVELKEKYPFLSPLYNIYKYPPKSKAPIHLDKFRRCTLNIPIQHTDNSYTAFYKVDDMNDIEYHKDRVFDMINSNVEEIYRFTLIKPTIMNTTIPHGVVNDNENTRIIMSWSVDMSVSFEDLREKYGS